jgi:hypothetical protein
MANKLSVIITTYNSANFIGPCLTALLKSGYADLEIIVVDNASTDNTLALVKNFSEIKVLPQNKNLGFGRANNLGAKTAHGDYLVFMNPDVWVEPDTLRRLTEFLDTRPHAGIVGPQLIYPDGQIQDSFRRFMKPHYQIIKRLSWLLRIKRLRQSVKKYLMWNQDPHTDFRCDWLVGAMLMIRSPLFKEIGGFDERYFLFMEDTDLCRAAAQKNAEVWYHHLARAQHNHQRLSDRGAGRSLLTKTFWIHVRSAGKYYAKWWRK